MDNLNRLGIREADDWVSVETPVYKQESELQPPKDDKICATDSKKSVRILSPVVTFQLVLMLIVMIASFLCKTFLYEKFSFVKECYDSEICASMFFNGDFELLNYTDFFGVNNAQN